MSRDGAPTGSRKHKNDNNSSSTSNSNNTTRPPGRPHQNTTIATTTSPPVLSPHARSGTNARAVEAEELESRSHDEAKRFRRAVAILCICIVSFVMQTELTKFVQTAMGYQKPYFILYISHSFWAIAFPAQFLYTTYLSPTAPRPLNTFRDRVDYFARLIRQCTSSLYHRKNDYTLVGSASAESLLTVDRSSNPSSALNTATVFTSRENKVLSRYLFWIAFGMTTLFMVPSYLWYTCVAMTSMANLTAIYNTSCFFAYLFSVMMLKEKIIGNKVLAVFLSLLGVAIISLTTSESSAPDSQVGAKGGNRDSVSTAGDVLALIGAALYGFEEVVYKKFASPKQQAVTFANTLTGLMGVVTCTMLWVPIPILHWMGHEIFELPTLHESFSILMIAALGLIYNGCFMIVVSQTSPVFAAVGTMATIPLVALVDWVLFQQAVGWGNIIGGLSIVAGFAILVHENSKG